MLLFSCGVECLAEIEMRSWRCYDRVLRPGVTKSKSVTGVTKSKGVTGVTGVTLVTVTLNLMSSELSKMGSPYFCKTTQHEQR